MPTFIPLANAARTLGVSGAVLEEFSSRGWIAFSEHCGVVYLRGHQEYRAKFILHLRDRLHLSPAQISKVLRHQTAPYSTATVAEVLARPD